MLISSIIKRHTNTFDSPLNVIMTSCEDRTFDFFIKNCVLKNSTILSLQDSIYGNIELDIILCNNRIAQLEKCVDLSYYFHCPILVLDHDTKPNFLEKPIEFQSKSIYYVAINDKIYNSWQRTQDLVLSFNTRDDNNIQQWRNLLYQITKIPFSIRGRKPYEAQEATK
jgi:hypothetical protein